ncbi:unnamed protein product [Effrenium voratum]|nr:unnamed protein product [Effrenium voratum]
MAPKQSGYAGQPSEEELNDRALAEAVMDEEEQNNLTISETIAKDVEDEESESESECDEDVMVDPALLSNEVDVVTLTQAMEGMSLNELNNLMKQWEAKTIPLKNALDEVQKRMLAIKEKKGPLESKARVIARNVANKAKKAAKSKAKAVDKVEPITIIIQYQGQNYTITITKYDKLKQVRAELLRNHRGTFKTEKFLKTLEFRFDGLLLNNIGNGRTELGSLGVVNGSVIVASLPQQGNSNNGDGGNDKKVTNKGTASSSSSTK